MASPLALGKSKADQALTDLALHHLRDTAAIPLRPSRSASVTQAASLALEHAVSASIRPRTFALALIATRNALAQNIARGFFLISCRVLCKCRLAAEAFAEITARSSLGMFHSPPTRFICLHTHPPPSAVTLLPLLVLLRSVSLNYNGSFVRAGPSSWSLL